MNNPNKTKAEYSVVLDQSKKKMKIVYLRHLKNPFWETLHLLLSYYYQYTVEFYCTRVRGTYLLSKGYSNKSLAIEMHVYTQQSSMQISAYCHNCHFPECSLFTGIGLLTSNRFSTRRCHIMKARFWRSWKWHNVAGCFQTKKYEFFHIFSSLKQEKSFQRLTPITIIHSRTEHFYSSTSQNCLHQIRGASYMLAL